MTCPHSVKQCQQNLLVHSHVSCGRDKCLVTELLSNTISIHTEHTRYYIILCHIPSEVLYIHSTLGITLFWLCLSLRISYSAQIPYSPISERREDAHQLGNRTGPNQLYPPCCTRLLGLCLQEEALCPLWSAKKKKGCFFTRLLVIFHCINICYVSDWYRQHASRALRCYNFYFLAEYLSIPKFIMNCSVPLSSHRPLKIIPRPYLGDQQTILHRSQWVHHLVICAIDLRAVDVCRLLVHLLSRTWRSYFLRQLFYATIYGLEMYIVSYRIYLYFAWITFREGRGERQGNKSA